MKNKFVYSLTVLFVSGALSVSAQSTAPVHSATMTKRQLDASATAPKSQVNKSALNSGQVNQRDARPQSRIGNAAATPKANNAVAPTSRAATAPAAKSVAPASRAPKANTVDKRADVVATPAGK